MDMGEESQKAKNGAAKQVQPMVLAAQPPLLLEIFKCLAKAGVSCSCLFGGAVRDADLSALWGSPRSINDYDLRCWLPRSAMVAHDWEASFGLALLGAFDSSSLKMAPSAGTSRLRHAIHWHGLELDISARMRPSMSSTGEDCAKERALDADASLSSVAIDDKLQAWCERLYAVDRAEHAITYYPNQDMQRLSAYRERMRARFPDAIERCCEMDGRVGSRAPSVMRVKKEGRP